MDRRRKSRWRRITRMVVYGLVSGAASGAGAIALRAFFDWASSR